MIAYIVNVTFKVHETFFQRGQIFLAGILDFDAAVILQGAHSCHNHDRRGSQAGLATFNVNKFFSAQISAKTCFCNNVISPTLRQWKWQ
ncbi:MAG: hypothetical protein WDM70_10150 [Nitrosomonadales bacterium]